MAVWGRRAGGGGWLGGFGGGKWFGLVFGLGSVFFFLGLVREGGGIGFWCFWRCFWG